MVTVMESVKITDFRWARIKIETAMVKCLIAILQQPKLHTSLEMNRHNLTLMVRHKIICEGLHLTVLIGPGVWSVSSGGCTQSCVNYPGSRRQSPGPLSRRRLTHCSQATCWPVLHGHQGSRLLSVKILMLKGKQNFDSFVCLEMFAVQREMSVPATGRRVWWNYS